MESNNSGDWVKAIGEPAYQALAELVAAVECDYDRLDELRDDRDCADNPAQWAADNPADSAELAALESAAGECADRESAEERLREDPLSVRIFGERVAGEWAVDRVEILLTTGGPAVRIMVDVDCEPCRAWLEVQDWGKPWTQYLAGPGSGETILAYARVVGPFCD